MSVFLAGSLRNGALVSLLALGAGPILPGTTQAATRYVTNCSDSGPGSLRSAAGTASSGDIIDLTRLSCSHITLTSGEILLPQSDIELVGKGRFALFVHGNRASRVLHHTGTGTLAVRRMTLSYGHVANGGASGGCVDSSGKVELRQSRVHHCVAEGIGGLEPTATGGAISARGNVVVDRSSVFENTATAISDSYGGGIAANGRVILLHSQVYNNTAGNGGGVQSEAGLRAVYSILQNNYAYRAGGGADVHGSVEINKSTISGNRSVDCGGLCASGGPVVIADSTVSGNTAFMESALSLLAGDIRIFNSTITANVEEAADDCWGAVFSFGLWMESTIVSGNTCDGAGAVDVGGFGYPTLSGPVAGSHNLIGSSALPTPPDTLFTAHPGLAPLAWNGGPTRTHAVLSGSLAVDHGNNVLHRLYDQRGAPHARVRGPAPDIGAFER